MTDLRSTRRQVLKRAGVLGATAAVLSPTAAFAKQNDAAQGPEGSWLVNIAITSGPPLFPPAQALYTYAAGGGFVETDQTAFNPQALVSPAHGAWVSTGEHTFATTFFAFGFDAKGNPTVIGKGRERTTLDEDGDTYSGSGKFDLFDLRGNLLASITYSIDGKRISVEPF